jgi:hypothetical protein
MVKQNVALCFLDRLCTCRRLRRHATKTGEELIISTTPTHVVSELVEVLKSEDATGLVVQKLEPFTSVTLVRSENGWALIAKDGKALGYVTANKLHALQ